MQNEIRQPSHYLLLLHKPSTRLRMKKSLPAILVALALLLLSINSYASGSYRTPRSSSSRGGDSNQVYHLGKNALYHKLTCAHLVH